MNTVCGRGILSYLRLNQKLYSSGCVGARWFPATSSSTDHRSNGRAVVLEEVSKCVKPFGKVVVKLPCDIEIRPADLDRYPDMNALLVSIFVDEEVSGATTDTPTPIVSVESSSDDIWEVKGQDTLPVGAKCLIESPIRFDVDVQASGNGNVQVSGMISDSIVVRTVSGNISGEKLQASQMVFSSSSGGSVDLRRTLQGNIEINTVDGGAVRGDKFLGTDLKVMTKNGDVRIGSSYCTNSSFTTENGNLTLDNLHMDSRINIPGDGALNILCLDGSLDAKLAGGAARVRVVRLTNDSRVESEGDVALTVTEENPLQMKLKARQLDIDSGINGMEEHTRNVQKFKTFTGDYCLTVTTPKSIKVSKASWASTLNLGNFLR